MHIAIVDEELPYPATSGKRIRILNLVRHLAQRHKITLLCHRNADPEEAAQAEAYLEDLGVETVLVDRDRPLRLRGSTSLPFPLRVALNALSGVPYSVQWNECARLRQAVRQYAEEHSVDLWQCEWAPYATNVMGVRGVRWVMMAHDIQSCIWERYWRNEPHPLKRWYMKLQCLKYRRFERSVFADASLTITVTEEDADRVARQFAARRTAVVDNGVDVDYYAAGTVSDGTGRNPEDILFLGNLQWRPNIDAVRYLLDQVFPLVLAEVPSARLCIVGRRPPKWLVRRGQSARNVEVHGDVDDVRPFLRRCGAMAVPLRIGGGSRLKILEALASRLPVVSTGVGAEGLRMRPTEHFMLADSPEDMANVLVRWICHPASTNRMVANGRRLVEDQYDWSVIAAKMEEAWQELSNGARLQSAK